MSVSNVPKIEFTPAGLVIPSESAVLAGVQADINTAFGGGLNPALESPQGQLASSESAIIGDKNNEFAYYVNQVDPQYSAGRFQDAIGRIYYLERNDPTATAVLCTLGGVPGTVIPSGTFAQDTSGNTYASAGVATIGAASTVVVEFQNVETGPIPCPAGTLVLVYQAIDGWDTITNADAGVLGSNVETRAEFEYRRKNSVALNAHGSPQAIYGAVFNVPGVVDAYVYDNSNNLVSYTGAISATTLTVSAVDFGTLRVGAIVQATGIAADTYIREILTGSGGVGTYRVSVSQTLASTAMLTFGDVFGPTDFIIGCNSLYVAAVGGEDVDIANAIWLKKDSGCPTTGNTAIVVSDDTYTYPQPTYTINFNRNSALPTLFVVNIIDDPALPSDIVNLTKAAIIARFSGADGGYRERIGGTIFSSRYYPAVATLASYVPIDSILIGTVTATLTQVQVGIDQTPTIDAADITVNLI